MTWNLEQIWNESLIQERRKSEPRSHIYASEVGKDHWERWHKMNNTPVTNDYDERLLRKFAAGNFFEDMIGHVLLKIGILKSSQKRVETKEDETHLRVSGKADFEAGGVTDWTEAEKRVREAGFPEAVQNIALSLVGYFKSHYPLGLESKLYEVKSVNSQVFWAKKDYLEEAYPHHIFQTYTYMRELGYDSGTIMYISKDDLTVKEIDIRKTPELEKAWQDDVIKMTEFYRSKKEPPKPEEVIFDPRKKVSFGAKRELEEVADVGTLNKIAQRNGWGLVMDGWKIQHKGSFTENWQIEWSPYRYLLAGVKDEEGWDKYWYGVGRKASEKNQEIKQLFINRLKHAIETQNQ